MVDDLLWFYEGLTRFYGDLVLTANDCVLINAGRVCSKARC